MRVGRASLHVLKSCAPTDYIAKHVMREVRLSGERPAAAIWTSFDPRAQRNEVWVVGVQR